MNNLETYKKEKATITVYSFQRNFLEFGCNVQLKSNKIEINKKNVMSGLSLLALLPEEAITACFFDPQYRGIMETMKYGNEGKRQKSRAELPQMSEKTIIEFIAEIDRTLIKTGHIFLWLDKFHLCEGITSWLKGTNLEIVDLITWDKGRIGMGYRTRRKSEYCIILQKKPKRAKGVWIKHDIPDVWSEKVFDKLHPHQKPIELQKNLIKAVSKEGDLILDPCAGSYITLDACKEIGRNFIGCDIKEI